MKNKIQILFLVVAIGFGLANCSGSKSYYKKGKKLEKNGLTIEAANFYIESLRRKKSNEDAIIALKGLGQRVLDEKYATFYKFYADERYKNAVYAFIDAEEFKSKAAAVGVILSSSPYYIDYFKESRDIYVTSLYDDAQEYLNNEAFTDAERNLNEIKKLDPSYKNVNALSDFAFIEPKYRQGLRAYDAQEYRKAYYLFQEINKRAKEGYKESIDYQALALESATYTIAVLGIEDKQNSTLATGISGGIISSVKSLNDPFLRLIDRTTSTLVREEQFINMSTESSQSQFIQTSENLGSDAILIGKIVSAKSYNGNLIKSSRTGWIGKEVRYIDPVTKDKKTRITYSKVYYYEYEQTNWVNCTFQYQLISTKTGEVLLSDIVETKKEDQIHYATFNGDTKLLIPGFWKNQYRNDQADRRYDSYSNKRALDALLRSRTTIKSLSELQNNVFDELGVRVATNIGAFNPEKK